MVLALGVLGLASCGDQQAPEVATGLVAVDCGGDSCPDEFLTYVPLSEMPTPTAGSLPTETPTEQPPLDRTELEANLAKLSPEDRVLVDHYIHEAKLGEGTWVVAAPMTVEEAKARLLGPNPRLMTRADEKAMMNARISAYTFVQLGDGVLAYEDTGFADPPKRLLAELSRDGAVSAVATENIEAMRRFGYARDGQVVFDAFEYAFVPDLNEIPAELRDLAALAWDDLEGPMVASADRFAVALAMGEKVTGVRATADGWTGQDRYVVPLPWGAAEDY